MLTNDHALFCTFYLFTEVFQQALFFNNFKCNLILIYRSLFNCLFAKLNLEVLLFTAHEFKKVLESLILLF